MTRDALDPVDGTYPAFPRLPNGAPAWSDDALTDGVQVPGRGPDGVVTPMPRGTRILRRDGERIVTDITPRHPDGTPIEPPTLP